MAQRGTTAGRKRGRGASRNREPSTQPPPSRTLEVLPGESTDNDIISREHWELLKDFRLDMIERMGVLRKQLELPGNNHRSQLNGRRCDSLLAMSSDFTYKFQQIAIAAFFEASFQYVGPCLDGPVPEETLTSDEDNGQDYYDIQNEEQLWGPRDWKPLDPSTIPKLGQVPSIRPGDVLRNSASDLVQHNPGGLQMLNVRWSEENRDCQPEGQLAALELAPMFRFTAATVQSPSAAAAARLDYMVEISFRELIASFNTFLGTLKVRAIASGADPIWNLWFLQQYLRLDGDMIRNSGHKLRVLDKRSSVAFANTIATIHEKVKHLAYPLPPVPLEPPPLLSFPLPTTPEAFPP